MKNNIENGIYIPDENRELHPLDEWMKREDPDHGADRRAGNRFRYARNSQRRPTERIQLQGRAGIRRQIPQGLPLRNPPRGDRNVRRPVPGPRQSVQEDRRPSPLQASTGRAIATPIRIAIPVTHSYTTAPRAALATNTRVTQTPCVRFPLSRNSFTV